MIAVERFAWRMRGLALASSGESLLSVEPGGRLLSVVPGDGVPEEIGRLPEGVLDLQVFSEGLAILLREGRLLETDPSGRVRSERSVPAVRGLAVDPGGSLWFLESSRLRCDGKSKVIDLEVPVRVVRFDGPRLVGTCVHGPRRVSRFRWRGLAPGAGSAAPGEGVRFELISFDSVGKVDQRTSVAQEPVGFTVLDGDRWFSSLAAEGFERLGRPGE